ncbi:hypothetical protein CROQUDRAFT_668962 [Cronartium quercuum f. sp. fusiforme G11]|uniref:FH2 domain-containing protein n=1 Tax=Cronartium quercuum f. sp. fusiforme G11 TaxID=708437 RepID=A0A9P6NT76_9BASI|nr:hypothetical protein CROQUDRAFT_668962 [Cronartium quercuum f. sp. fusiforme G11]
MGSARARITIWADDHQGLPTTVDLRDLLKDFSIPISIQDPSGSKKKRVTKTLLSLNRANNIGQRAILSLNDECLNLETLKALRLFSPTADEIEAIKSFEGDRGTLSRADQYFIKVMDIPRLHQRLTAMIYRRRFETEVDELGPELGVLRCATAEIRNSLKLRKIMLCVLEIGNVLNASTFRGNATGFELSALLKVEYRLSFSDVMGSVKTLLGGMSQLKEEMKIAKSSRLSFHGDYFLVAMETFVAEAELTMKALQRTTDQIKDEIRIMVEYLGQDPKSRAEDVFGALSTFKSDLERAVDEVLDAGDDELHVNSEIKHLKDEERIQSPRQASDLMQAPRTPIGHGKDQSLTSSIGSSRKLLFGKGGLDTAIHDMRTGSILRRHRQLRDEISPSRARSPASRFFLTG